LRQGSLEELCGTSSRWRVRFRAGADRQKLAELGFVAAGDAFCCDAPDAESLNRLLDRARASGALLVELARDLKELEQVLAESLATSRGGICRPRHGDA